MHIEYCSTRGHVTFAKSLYFGYEQYLLRYGMHYNNLKLHSAEFCMKNWSDLVRGFKKTSNLLSEYW